VAGLTSFGSDNHSPVHPDVLAAIVEANSGDAPSYGDDPWTARAQDLFKVHFGPDADAYPVFTGTGANVLALGAMLRPYEGVICSDVAHLHTDECGAPERHLGAKLLAASTVHGKLTVRSVAEHLWGVGDEHHAQMKVLSITQSTEFGTRYSLNEVSALADWAHGHGMLVHLDGARLANAAAGLGVGLGEATTGCGVDVVSFGATKNGGMGAEAVVFLRPGLAGGFRFLRKQAMQLASKMRFVSAQLVALLTDDLWLRNAAHANAMAQRLAAGVSSVAGVRISHPVEANAIFAILPPDAVEPLRERFPFYTWDANTGEVRWMTSFATTEADVDAFVAALSSLAAEAAPGTASPVG
jgi:threonine aldolase